MKTLGTLIQAGLLSVGVVYFLPHLVTGIREIIQELKEGE